MGKSKRKQKEMSHNPSKTTTGAQNSTDFAMQPFADKTPEKTVVTAPQVPQTPLKQPEETSATEEMSGLLIRVELSDKNNPEKTPPQSIHVGEPSAPQKQATQPIHSSAEAINSTATDSNSVELTNELHIRFSGYMKPWDVPSYPDVALAAMSFFQQEGMICRPIYLGSEILYKFIFRKEVPKTGNHLEFLSRGNTYKIPLYAWEPDRNQKEKRQGTLITMRRAAEDRVGMIPAAVFYKAIASCKLDLIVPTKGQRIKNTRAFNGNRFCVVETPSDLKKIPDSITVTNPFNNVVHHVRLSYFGQEIFCARCQVNHVGQCPEIKAFYEAKKQKEKMVEDNKIVAKIYSDSTLRSADTLGLCADVCAMSGGGLGQVIQASLDDPQNIQHERILIMGSTNDQKEQNFTTNESFAANIDLSLEKLGRAAEMAPDKTFYLVQQIPHDGEDDDEVETEEREFFAATDDRIRASYVHGRMSEVAEAVTNVECVTVQYEADQTGHPTEAGTAQILKLLDQLEVTSEPLIWNENFIVSSRPYRHVESIFRYGCNVCNRYGNDLSRDKHSHQLLCDECFEVVQTKAAQPNQFLQQTKDHLTSVQEQMTQLLFPAAKRHRSGAIGQSEVNNESM